MSDTPPIDDLPGAALVGLIDGNTLVPMTSPDGGACDAYKKDKAGNLLVPATDVPVMLSHGFVVAAGGE